MVLYPVLPRAPDLLSDAGPVASSLGDRFESRPEQLRMAAAVAKAMDQKSHLLVEAGTGVGKSFAYLVPAMLRAATLGEVVVISTHTIALQEQLIQKDIPLLQSALADVLKPLPHELKPVLVKGRGNYVSIRRLEQASKRQDRLFADPAARRSLHVIEDWAMHTRDGTLSTLPMLERPGVWDKVQSDSANCMGRKCVRYEQCFYQGARREMDGANLLVCNHALFFSDLALRAEEAGFLPEYQHVILDEAHTIEEVAAEHFGVSLGEGRVNHLLRTLSDARGKGYLPQLALLIQDTQLVEQAIQLVEQATHASRAFFDELHTLIRRGPESGTTDAKPRVRAEASSLRLRQPGAAANVMTPAFRELSMRLRALKDAIKSEPDKYELNAYALRAESIAVDAEILVSQTLAGQAYWTEVSGRDDDAHASRFQRVTLASSPIDIAPILKEHLFSPSHSVILTSATLTTRTIGDDETGESGETAFAHALTNLGCEGAATLQLGSPFDYATQVEFIVDLLAEEPGPGGGGLRTRRRGETDPPRFVPDDEHTPFADRPRAALPSLPPLPARILHHVEATKGGAFVLFTSLATLYWCASQLAGPLSARGYPLLVQGRDAPRTQLLERFRENDRSVLFGAASFWQGVDVRGQALRNVIITKLPFDPPDRPLTEARYELITSRGGDPFLEDSVPRAVIKFKQGFGRLIRSKSDHGRVVVLDPRLMRARYGRLFQRALPQGVHPVVLEAE